MAGSRRIELPTRVAVVREVCARVDDATLTALSAAAQAFAACQDARVADAYALVERTIPTLESGQVRLEWAAEVYGLLLHECRGSVDSARWQAWADSMGRWGGAHQAGHYLRVCDVYRLEWTDRGRELLFAASALDGVNARAVAFARATAGRLRSGPR